MNHLKMTVAGLGMLMLTACNGIFDDIYDEPEEIVPAKGQIVMNATSWTDWYYVDLPKLQKLTEAGDEAALLKAQTEFEAYPIPMTATGEKDKSEAGHAAATAGRKAGQYATRHILRLFETNSALAKRSLQASEAFQP